MAKILHYLVHPAQRQSRANRALWAATADIQGITRVDLYGAYPRFDIDVAAEQGRLVAHDVLVLQFPIYWYSSPSLLKEWQDLVLEYGFAYGTGGTALVGKTLLLAVTASGSAAAYGADGYQGFPLRTFLTPFEQLARLCGMRFCPPYTLFGAVQDGASPALAAHAEGFRRLLAGLRDDRIDLDGLAGREVLSAADLPRLPELG